MNGQKPKRVKMKYKKTAATRESVYSAAVSLMAEKGYAGATIRDICRRASVSPATFYSYYGSKFDILWDMYRESNVFFRDTVSKEVFGKPFYEQLRIFTSSYARMNIETGLDLMRVLFNPENAWFTHPRPMQEVLREIFSEAIEKSLLKSEKCTSELVDYMFVLLRGVCFDWCIHEGAFDLEAAMLEHIDTMLFGLLGEKACAAD